LPATVFTTQDIARAGITTPQDFLRLTPGVSLAEGTAPSNSQITIRGVSETYSQSAESPVGVIIDGIPLTSPNAFNGSFFDLQTIEILKGPENAIYGRNAIAGAIVINTQPPPDVYKYSLTGDATNGGGYRGILKIGGPIVPGLITASVVASEDTSNGFYENITTGKKIDSFDNQSVNGRVYVTPNEDITIDLKAAWSEMQGGGQAFHGQCPCNPYYTGKTPDVNNSSEPYVADLEDLARNLRNNASMRADYRTDIGTFSFTTAYNFNKDNLYGPGFPYIPAPAGKPDATQGAQYANSAYFEELKYISDKLSRFRYQIGADYYDFETDGTTFSGYTLDRTQLDGIGPFPIGSPNPTTQLNRDLFHTKAWELFGEATYDITQRLTFDTAFRYSRNDITDKNISPPAFSSTSGQTRSEAYAKAEPRVSLNYKVSPLINVYADWSLGSLPGGFNATGSSASILKNYPKAIVSDIYSQESSLNYEIGFNSQWLDRRLTLNGAAYYDLLTNQQYEQFFPLAGVEVTNTIDHVRIYGGELEVDAVPGDGWRLSVGVGLVAAKIEGFGADPTAVGNRPPYTPDYNLMFAIDKNVRISDTIQGFARFDDSVKGTEYWEADNLPGGRTNVINIANMRAGFTSGHVKVTAFVKNLADNRYNESNFVLSNTAVATYLAPPRIYGMEVTVGF
jgi:iron complex outermembrane receptor protein